jgi:glycosyltransferase involved in cell wall biosynthesis
MTKTKVRIVKQSTKLSTKNVTQKLQKKRVELSAVVVVHNEEKQLEDCLKTLKFADEIVVVLDKCTDRSKDIAKKYANKIVEGSWEIEGIRRNKSLVECSGDWILEVDADERVSKELAKEIRNVIKNAGPGRFRIWFDNYIGKRLIRYGWLRSWGVLEKQCLTYKGYKRYKENSRIHPESVFLGEVKDLQNHMTHYLDDNLDDALNRLNRYTNWMANDMIQNKKVYVNDCGKLIVKGGKLKYYRNFCQRFVKSYFFKKGYKEGMYGVFIALMIGLYPLISYMKAVERLENKK